MVRSVVFTTTVIQGSWFNSRPILVAASLDKMLHDDSPSLVETNKQQIKEARSKTQAEKIAAPSLSRDR